MVSTNGAVLLGGAVKAQSKSLGLDWQSKAWRFYGAPDGTKIAKLRTNEGALGEVRFVMGWEAEQIGRVTWDVYVDGKVLPQEQSNELMLKVANEQSTIAIATNLMVAGELNYVGMTRANLDALAKLPNLESIIGPDFAGVGDDLWVPVSVVDDNRDEILKAGADNLNLKALWPHPAKPTVPDPPLHGVIDVLDEIEQLQDLAYSQNRSRIAQMGILTVATEFDLASPSGDFGTDLELMINAPIADPRESSAAPILIRGPFELMTGALSNGARGVQWTRPMGDFDERLPDKMKFAIQRLAYGFPAAPEILLGMTATNRAVAFQIEESTYRSHVEPIAKLVGRVYARALRMIAENKDQRIEVKPDATDLLAKRHSVADAKDLYDRGLVRAEYVRRTAGIPEEDKATEEDMERIERLKGGGGDPERLPDPSEVSGNEPVRASAALDPDDLEGQLRGAVDMAFVTAISRIGAAARNRIGRAGEHLVPDLGLEVETISNKRLPSMLGPDRLGQLGLGLENAIDPVVDQLTGWWRGQLDIDGAYDAVSVDESVETLQRFFRHWCLNGTCSWPMATAQDDFTGPILSPLRPEVLESATEEEVQDAA